MPTMIDLFCGVGGISMGFEAAGFRVLGGNDYDELALQAFALNHPGARVWPGKIEDLDPLAILNDVGLEVGELDVLAGGPPCQGFSRNRARRHIDGEFVDDPRNYLFKEFLRFVETMRPKVVVIENVPEILVKEDGAFGREIIARLAGYGYETQAAVLRAADYGVPQRRRRAVFLASLVGSIPLPLPTHAEVPDQDSLFPLEPYVTIWEAIGDLAGLQEGDGGAVVRYPREPFTPYQKERRGENEEVTDHFAWHMSDVQRERLSYLGEGDGCEKLPPHLAPKSGYGSAYRRMSRNIPALTITTWMYHPGSGMFFHPTDARTITLREGARLQSFDDSTVFVGGKTARCRQVGNAVPPLLARAIADSIKPVLDRASRYS